MPAIPAARDKGWHWGSFIFDGVSVSDGTKYEHLDEAKAALATWLKSF